MNSIRSYDKSFRPNRDRWNELTNEISEKYHLSTLSNPMSYSWRVLIKETQIMGQTAVIMLTQAENFSRENGHSPDTDGKVTLITVGQGYARNGKAYEITQTKLYEFQSLVEVPSSLILEYIRDGMDADDAIKAHENETKGQFKLWWDEMTLKIHNMP